jgi:hypothetical protein
MNAENRVFSTIRFLYIFKSVVTTSTKVVDKFNLIRIAKTEYLMKYNDLLKNKD